MNYKHTLKFIDEIRMAKRINPDLGWNGKMRQSWQSSPDVMNVVYTSAYQKSVEHAVVVDVQNLVEPAVERIEKGSIICAEEYPNFRLPYPEMWFEYKPQKTSKLNLFGYSERIGMLARCLENAPHINARLRQEYQNHKKGRPDGCSYVEFALFVKAKGVIVGPSYMIAIEIVRETGTIRKVSFTNYADKRSYDAANSKPTGTGEAIVQLKGLPIDWGKKTDLAISLMIPGVLAVQLMNCKNVRQIDKEPPTTINERHRRDHPPMVKYKVLKVDRSKTTHHTAPGEVKNPDMLPYHFCRGHFKTFTTEKPLLGKHVGMYWWDAHARGDRKRGEVIKDYEFPS